MHLASAGTGAESLAGEVGHAGLFTVGFVLGSLIVVALVRIVQRRDDK